VDFVAAYSCEGSGGFAPRFPIICRASSSLGFYKNSLTRGLYHSGLAMPNACRPALSLKRQPVHIHRESVAHFGLFQLPWNLLTTAIIYLWLIRHLLT
jgi:hypothetical protein